MKHLTTLLALLLSCSMLAQGPVEFPWNPDADGDDFIGVNDLMALLGEYSTSFSEENLYLSEDSLSATYHIDNGMNYFECKQACRVLPGRWKLPSMNEIEFDIFDQNNHDVWIETSPENLWHTHDGKPRVLFLSVTQGTDALARVDPLYASNLQNCYCVTKERPKVEYSFCDGADPSHAAFTQCINEKLAEGWYPLSGFPNHHDIQAHDGNPGNTPVISTYHEQKTHASFWRWAE